MPTPCAKEGQLGEHEADISNIKTQLEGIWDKLNGKLRMWALIIPLITIYFTITIATFKILYDIRGEVSSINAQLIGHINMPHYYTQKEHFK